MNRQSLSGVLNLIFPVAEIQLVQKWAYLWSLCEAPHRGWGRGARLNRVESRGIQQEVPGHQLELQREQQGLPLLGGWLQKQ